MMIGHLSLKTLIQMIEANLLKNFPLNKEDILGAEDLFGLDLGSLKGKNTKSKTKYVPAFNNNTPPRHPQGPRQHYPMR